MPTPKHTLSVFTFIFQLEVLLVWLIFGPIFGALLALPQEHYFAYIGLIWWLVFGATFFQYCFTILEYTARGHERVPRMAADVFQRDARLPRAAIYMAVALSFVLAAPGYWQYPARIILFALTPAVLAFITFRAPLSSALNPVNLWRFIRNMGWSYSALRFLSAMTLSTVVFLLESGTTLFASALGRFLFGLLGTYLLLTLFRATGVLLHYRHDALGIATDFSQAQLDSQASGERQQARSDILVQLHKLSRADKHDEAWSLLENELKRSRYAEAEIWFEELQQLEEPRLFRRLAQGHIGRLADAGDPRAWPIYLSIARQRGEPFRLNAGSAVLALASCANTDEEVDTSLTLLENFDRHFPDHPRSREACLLAAKICCNRLDLVGAKQHFDKVTRRRGKISRQQYEAVKARLNTNSV